MSVDFMFHMQRRPGYHVVSIIFPTFVLMVMAELALFIDKSHFEATIMVALTIMLVLYTLYQSVSQGLPKTPYLTLIDVWLLFGLILPFFIFTILILENSLHKNTPKTTPIVVKELMQDKTEQRRQSYRSTALKVCKIALPIITIVFVIVFLIVAYMGA